jgi:hypothetical protein
LLDELTERLFCLTVEDGVVNKTSAWLMDPSIFLSTLVITEDQKARGDAILCKLDISEDKAVDLFVD